MSVDFLDLGNGTLDPGENTTMQLILTNVGHSPVSSPTFEATTSDPNIILGAVESDNAYWWEIDSQVTITIEVAAVDDALVGHTALLGIIIGSPIGLYLLKYLNPQTTHLSVCLLVIFFSILLMKGFSNQKINNNYGKFFTGMISGTLNGLTTLGGMPVALFLLITSIQPAVIRGSLAALFFLTDIYAFVLSFFSGIVDMTTIYRVIPLIIILPLGVFIGDKFFVKSKEETYRKVVFYFLIIISIIGVLRIISNF